MDVAWPIRTQNSRHLVLKQEKLYTIGKTGKVNIFSFFFYINLHFSWERNPLESEPEARFPRFVIG